MPSAAKEHVEIYKAKVEEKLEKAAARTEEEKRIAEERRKAKEAEAKKGLHKVKAWHAAEKLSHKQAHLRHHPPGHHDPPLHSFIAPAAPVYGQNEPTVGHMATTTGRKSQNTLYRNRYGEDLRLNVPSPEHP